MIKKLLLLSIFLFTTLLADAVKWENDYKSAVERAKKENRAIIFLLTRDNCRYCIKLEKEILTDKNVIKKLNSNFVSLKMDSKSQNYPYQLRANGVPTMWILAPDGTPVAEPIVGMMAKSSYLNLFDAVKKAMDETTSEK